MAGITHSTKAQGATEYIVLVSVVLMISLVCVAILVWPTGTSKDAKKQQTDIHFKINEIGVQVEDDSFQSIIQGLVAYYKFDEGSGTSAADSRGGNTATLIYGPSWTTGKSGYALSFGGNGSNADGSAGISTANGATVLAWVNPVSLSSCGSVCTIMRIGSQDGIIGYHWLYYSGNALNWQYANGTAYRTSTASYTLPLNTWTHVAVTHDYGSRELKFYVNGTQVGASQTNAVVSFSNNPVRIGAYGTTSHTWNGTIDEVMIFNRALSASEILLLYENPGYPQ